MIGVDLKREAAHGLQSVHHRHLDIHQDDVWVALFRQLNRFQTITCVHDSIAMTFQVFTDRQSICYMIFSQKHHPTIQYIF